MYLRGSLCCDVREATGRPLCGIHAAATTRWLQRFEFAAGGQGSRAGPRATTTVS